MISLSNIELRRGVKLLLNDAELSVHPGQHIGIIGANGSGKSSLFKLLMGQVTVDAGELSIPSDWRIAHMAQELATSERSALDFVIDGDPVLREVEATVEAALNANNNNQLANAYEKNGYHQTGLMLTIEPSNCSMG